MSDKPFDSIVSFCERKLDEHGDSYLGVGWTKRPEDADTRYRVMLDVIREPASEPVTILDFGCGLAHLLAFIQRDGRQTVRYSGLDVSPRYLDLSRRKYPDVTFYELDVLEDDAALPMFDYIVMNGIFTAKCELSQEEMVAYFEQLVSRVFAKARRGIAFNVMSKQVEWERPDLFHLPMDQLATFLATRLSRHFVIRHDYRLYEYTAYVYR